MKQLALGLGQKPPPKAHITEASNDTAYPCFLAVPALCKLSAFDISSGCQGQQESPIDIRSRGSCLDALIRHSLNPGRLRLENDGKMQGCTHLTCRKRQRHRSLFVALMLTVVVLDGNKAGHLAGIDIFDGVHPAIGYLPCLCELPDKILCFCAH